MSVIGQVGSLIGILVFLFTMKHKVDDALAAIKAPPSLSFYFLFFWVVAAALLGGLMWAACQQVFPSLISSNSCAAAPVNTTPTLGGSREPHGLAAFLWPIVTNIPVMSLLLVLAIKYKFIPVKEVALGSLLMLVFLGVASLFFCDLPLFGYRGFRYYIEARGVDYVKTELYLVIIWSTILAIIPFLGMYGASKFGWIVGPARSLVASGAAVGLIVGMTTVSVGFFIAGYPYPVFEAARGTIAGLALRVSLFFGFIISSKP